MPRKKAKPTNGNYYEVKITIGKNIDGKPIRKSFLSKISKADARKKADNWKIDNAAKMMIGEPFFEDKTLDKWADEWLRTYKSGKSDATYCSYEKPIRLQIKPYFSGVRLQDITPVSIQQFYNQLPKGRSESWYHKVYLALSGMLESAVDNNLLARSPHRGIDPPKGNPPVEKRTYSQNERDELLKAAKAHPRGLSVAMLLELGLRREELLALTWEDVDLVHNTISIHQAIRIAKDGTAIVERTKNISSTRLLPISKEFSKYLEQYQSTGYVLKNRGGNYWHPTSWNRWRYTPVMKELCTALKIPVLNPHELRHTCGTLLYNATHDIYAVSKYLGHSGIDITARIYVHNNVESLRDSLAIDKKVHTVQQCPIPPKTQVK